MIDRPRTRPQMTIDTRAKLIALARRQFGRKGYAATALDDLTLEAGLTRGALYHHFGSKLGLFTAVVEEVEAAIDLHFMEANRQAADRWEGFRAGCRAYFQDLRDPEIRRIVVLDAPAVIPSFNNRPRKRLCTEAIVQDLSLLIEEGKLRPFDGAALIGILSGAVDSAAAWAAAQADPAASIGIASLAIDNLLDGLCHPEAPD